MELRAIQRRVDVKFTWSESRLCSVFCILTDSIGTSVRSTLTVSISYFLLLASRVEKVDEAGLRDVVTCVDKSFVEQQLVKLSLAYFGRSVLEHFDRDC